MLGDGDRDFHLIGTRGCWRIRSDGWWARGPTVFWGCHRFWGEENEANKQQTATNNQHTAANNQHTASNNQHTATNNQHTATNNQHTASNNQHTATNNQHTATNNQQTATNNQQTASNNQQTKSIFQIRIETTQRTVSGQRLRTQLPTLRPTSVPQGNAPGTRGWASRTAWHPGPLRRAPGLGCFHLALFDRFPTTCPGGRLSGRSGWFMSATAGWWAKGTWNVSLPCTGREELESVGGCRDRERERERAMCINWKRVNILISNWLVPVGPRI